MKYVIIKPKHKRFKLRQFRRRQRATASKVKYKRSTIVRRIEFLDENMQIRGTKIVPIKKPILNKL